MISCLTLERPGVWRVVGVAILFSLAALPIALLILELSAAPAGLSPGRGFGSALINSLTVALSASVLSWLLGLPAGVLAALYDFPGRRLLLPLSVLPLLAPSFLWAIGWSALLARLGPDMSALASGRVGCLLVSTSGVFPLVWLTAFAATRALSGSQVEAARLAGGERTVLVHCLRHAAPIAGLAAGLSGVLSLSDLGPGLIFGLRTAAAEVLTSFSALYDTRLAAWQCLLLAGVVLLAAGPLAVVAAPRLAAALLPRQMHGLRRGRSVWGGIAAALFLIANCLSVILPALGLLLPLFDANSGELARAWGEVKRTWLNTLLYAGGAGAVATGFALLLALCAGRSPRLLVVSLALCLVLFSLPPALQALGVVRAGASAPAWLDPLLRSRLTVCLTLGLRLFPVAALLVLRAWAAMPASWTQAGAIHGLSLRRYLLRVVVPYLLPALAVSELLVALLATADVGTVLLVHPPGQGSLPLAIFTVMSNAPEALVASVCLLYLVAAAGLLMLIWAGVERRGA
jgi:iron(III) transport system permease protein